MAETASYASVQALRATEVRQEKDEESRARAMRCALLNSRLSPVGHVLCVW